MKAYTVGEFEMKLAQRFGGQAYEAVCDVVNGLIRVYVPRKNEELKKQLEEEHKACAGAKEEVNYWFDRYLKTKHGKDAKGEAPHPDII